MKRTAIACYTVASIIGLLGLWRMVSGDKLDMAFAFYMALMALIGEWLLRMEKKK